MSEKPDKRLWTGHCWLCGERVMDVLESWPGDHALEGQPRSFGRPVPGTKRVTMVRLRSGRLTDITLCKDCEPTPDRMAELSHRLDLRYRIEDSPWWNEAVGRSARNPLTEDQKLRKVQASLLYHADPILGEIARQELS